MGSGSKRLIMPFPKTDRLQNNNGLYTSR